MPLNLPIILTWLRIAMIPLVVGLFYIPFNWMSMPLRDTIAALAFIIAAACEQEKNNNTQGQTSREYLETQRTDRTHPGTEYFTPQQGAGRLGWNSAVDGWIWPRLAITSFHSHPGLRHTGELCWCFLDGRYGLE